MNNKVLTQIAELNLKNERAKDDISLRFPQEQQIPIWIYKMTRFDDPSTPFLFNESDNVTNIIGMVKVKESVLYIESEFKDLFTSTATQIQLIDNRDIYGYIQDDLDFNQDTHFITFEEFYPDDNLKKVFLIDNNNQYDETNSPEIERVQLKNIVEELNFNTNNRIKFVGAEDKTDTTVTSFSVSMQQPTALLSELSIFDNNNGIDSISSTTCVPVPINILSTSGKDVKSYLPWADNFLYPRGGISALHTAADIKYEIGEELFALFLNVLSISHMVQINFAGVKEDGFVPSAPSTTITPSAGWYWKTRMEGKDSKGVAAEIQNLIDTTRVALESGQYYGDIDSNNPIGNLTNTSNTVHPVQWETFYAYLNLFCKQIFSNYSFQYGGTFDAEAYFPATATFKMSNFAKPADGSEMYKFDSSTVGLQTPVNIKYSPVEEVQSSTYFEESGSNETIFYYEGSFNTRTAGEVYVIDYKYAKEIPVGLSTTNLVNLQNAMIKSPGATAIGRPNSWTFVNNADNFQNNKAGSFQIPQSVFENLDDPVFYYALTKEEIDDYYNEGKSVLNKQGAGYGSGQDIATEFFRGYPGVPYANEIKTALNDASSKGITLDVEYLIVANSQMKDDAGSNNDYRLLMQDADVKVTTTSQQDITKINTILRAGVSYKDINDGVIPYSIPSDTLVAQTLGKSVGENSDNIINAPMVWVPIANFDALLARFRSTNPYDDLESHISALSGDNSSYYSFDILDRYSTLSEVNMNIIGNAHYRIIITYEDGTSFGISGNSEIEGKYDNTLYLEPSEDFLDTLTILNFGVN